MEHEPPPGFARFFAYLNFFMAMMRALGLGGSLPGVFVGWGGVGLYVTCGMAPWCMQAPAPMTTVAVVGALTALFAASIGLVQNDIKKVLAYSTVSQLGYMMLAAGVGAFSASIFHLMTHAFFKALLFLGAGSVIHAMSGEQDLRKMGGLAKALPWTYRTMFVGALAIAGIPFLSGFFSKDEILWSAWKSGH